MVELERLTGGDEAPPEALAFCYDTALLASETAQGLLDNGTPSHKYLGKGTDGTNYKPHWPPLQHFFGGEQQGSYSSDQMK